MKQKKDIRFYVEQLKQQILNGRHAILGKFPQHIMGGFQSETERNVSSIPAAFSSPVYVPEKRCSLLDSGMQISYWSKS